MRCDPPALTKGEPGYLPARKLHFHVEVGEPLHANRLPGDETPAVAARRITEELRSYFQARLDHG